MYTKDVFLSEFPSEFLLVNTEFVYLLHFYIHNVQKVFLGCKGFAS